LSDSLSRSLSLSLISSMQSQMPTSSCDVSNMSYFRDTSW
jgi:hypothetical protein